MSDASAAESRLDWRRLVWNAVAFWEPARLAYNLALAVTAGFWLARIGDVVEVSPRAWLLSFALVNLLYTGVYPVDLRLQMRRDGAGWRPTLWFGGTFVVWTLLNMAFWLMHVFGSLVAERR